MCDFDIHYAIIMLVYVLDQRYMKPTRGSEDTLRDEFDETKMKVDQTQVILQTCERYGECSEFVFATRKAK